MLVRLIVASAIAAGPGCGQGGDSRDKPAPEGAGAAVGTSRAATPPALDAAAASDDAAFRALAEGVANRTARHLEGRGVARLAEDERGVPYAILEPDDLNEGRGAYLLEASPGQLWLVSFYFDGRTLAGLAEDGRAVEHAQGHHRGGETVRFGFRAGAPVVLYHEYVDDASEQEPPEIAAYAKDGVCAAPCPPLAGFESHDAAFQVVGPAATVDALIAKPE